MKVSGHTLIEGMVAMTLLSLLLSMVVMLSFRYYRSFPSQGQLVLESKVKMALDSLVHYKTSESVSFDHGIIHFTYHTEPFMDVSHVFVGTCEGQDTLGRVSVASGIYYLMDETN